MEGTLWLIQEIIDAPNVTRWWDLLLYCFTLYMRKDPET